MQICDAIVPIIQIVWHCKLISHTDTFLEDHSKRYSNDATAMPFKGKLV